MTSELKRYDEHVFLGVLPVKYGKYVLHSEAAAVIAAKDKEIERLKDDYQAKREELHRGWLEWCQQLKAELAKLTEKL